MNVIESEDSFRVIAKICGCKEKGKYVTYSFIDAYHSLCLNKKDIILAESEACERLLVRTSNSIDRKIIEDEIAKLKMALSYMS